METQKKINIWAKKILVKFKFWRIKTWSNITWYFKRYLAEFAFYIVEKVKNWHPQYYDDKIKNLYISVKTKESILLKEKIISLGKGEKQVKLLLIETPERTIKIKLEKVNFPNIYTK